MLVACAPAAVPAVVRRRAPSCTGYPASQEHCGLSPATKAIGELGTITVIEPEC
jgi:hypothetical protein